MQCSAVQCSAVQCSAVHCAVQCSAVQCAVQCYVVGLVDDLFEKGGEKQWRNWATVITLGWAVQYAV